MIDLGKFIPTLDGEMLRGSGEDEGENTLLLLESY